jgi:hypothetical protein
MTNLQKLKAGLCEFSYVNALHNKSGASVYLLCKGFVFYLTEHRYGFRIWAFKRYEQSSAFQFSVTKSQITEASGWLSKFLLDKSNVSTVPFDVSFELQKYGSECRYLWSIEAQDRAAKV